MAAGAASAGLGLLGAVIGAGGAFLGGRAGDIKRRRLEAIAETPGLDTGAISRQALEDDEKLLALATRLSGGVSAANQAQLLERERMAAPWAEGLRAENAAAIKALFADDQDWLSGVQRRGAAMGVGRGLFGGGAGQISTLRLSDQEKAQRTQLGSGLLGGLLNTLRIAQTPGVQAFLGPSPTELIGIRGQERTQRMNLMAQAAGIGGQTAAWSSYLNNVGGMLMGAGLGSMGGMGGGFGGGGGSSPPSGGYRVHPADQFSTEGYLNQWDYPG